MELSTKTNSELEQIIKDCREVLNNRLDDIENIIAQDDLQHYKSVYARLTVFFDFSSVVYGVKEKDLRSKFGSQRCKIVRNALINYLLQNGFSHEDIRDEFGLERTSVNAKVVYHNRHFMGDKKIGKLYTEIFNEIKNFFESDKD